MSDKSSLTGRQKAVRVFGGFALILVGVLYVALIWDSVFGNDGKPLTTLQPSGPNAQTIQNLTIVVFSLALVVGIAVLAGVLFITWKYRERVDDDGKTFPGQLHGNTTLEIGWTILPAILLMGIAAITVMAIIDIERTDDDALHVEVEGQQWWWSYNYDLSEDGEFGNDGDLTVANEMVIPTNRQVRLSITSNDVIHSFWIPALNGKKDAVPGMHTDWSIEASEVGVYRGQCTEFCGLSHANMRMIVRAVSPEDYERWLENQLAPAPVPAAGSLAASGSDSFGALCAQCHVIKGQHDKAADPATPPPLVSGIAPDLTKLMTRGTFAGSLFNLYLPDTSSSDSTAAVTGNPGAALYGDPTDSVINQPTLEQWLRNPPAMKPAYAHGGRGMPNLALSEEQIDEITAYLETLK